MVDRDGWDTACRFVTRVNGRVPRCRRAAAPWKGGAPVIGDRIRARRRELGMTQEQLAAGYFDRSYISRIEANEVIPPLPTLELLARRLGKPVTYFLGEAEEFAQRRVVHDYVRRGRRYARQRRFAEAAQSFATALDLLSGEADSPLLLAVHVEHAHALACLGRVEEAGRHLFAALTLLARVPLDRCPPGTAFRLHYTRGQLAFHRDELAVAAEAFRLAAAAAPRPADRIRAHVALGSTLFRQGRYEEALRWYATGVPPEEVDGDPGLPGEPGPLPGEAPAAGGGPARRVASRHDPGAATETGPVPVPTRHLPRGLVAACHHGLGSCYGALGRLERAARHLERAIQLYRGRDPVRQLMATHDLAIVQSRQGAWKPGRARLRHCLRGYRRAGRLDGVASVLVDLARLELEAGRHRRALVLARLARRRAREAQRPHLYLSAMDVEARALEALDPAAARALDDVVDDLRALG